MQAVELVAQRVNLVDLVVVRLLQHGLVCVELAHEHLDLRHAETLNPRHIHVGSDHVFFK